MSGLELVASIAGVAAAAIKVSVSMSDLAEELGSAGRDVRYIGNDMAGFSQVLRLVQSSLEESVKSRGSTVIQSVFETLPQLVEQCQMVYDEANGLMVALKPDEDASISFFKRMKFIFYKGRITILRSLLDSSKSTLNLLLVTLNIEMAKSKHPDKALMEQLQNERKAFIRVVYSQNKALDEATKEIEKARKEAAKFKGKRDKDKDKGSEEKIGNENSFGDTPSLPQRQSAPYSYKPPPPYTAHFTQPAPQLVYQPPSLDRINSVKNSSNAVRRLALSLEPTSPGGYGMPTPPSSPPDNGPYGSSYSYTAYTPYPPPPPAAQTEPQKQPEASEARPQQPGKRNFSDPGPRQSDSTPSEHLDPGTIPRERSRSPYGFSRVPQDDLPKVERKRPPFNPSSQGTNTANSAHTSHRNFSTPANGSGRMDSVAEESEPPSADSSIPTATPTPTTEGRTPSFTYQTPPPPPPPTFPEAESTSTQHDEIPPPVYTRTDTRGPRKPLPRHNTAYVVVTPYLSHEIGHLSLVPFDTLVDVSSYTSEEASLPYPTAFDTQPKHYWQGSLGNRRGPRGLLPHDTVCPIDDIKVTQLLYENWFAERSVGLIADAQGRVWIGPGWEWKDPLSGQ